MIKPEVLLRIDQTGADALDLFAKFSDGHGACMVVGLVPTAVLPVASRGSELLGWMNRNGPNGQAVAARQLLEGVTTPCHGSS